jgi:hypothetical protein
MSTAEQPRRRRSQRPSLRRSDDWTTLPSVLVGGTRYERMADPDGRQWVEIPGVDGTDETAPIERRLARFVGVPVCVDVSVRQANRYITAEAPVEADDDVSVSFVGGLTGWSIALDGVTVYGRMAPDPDAVPSLIMVAGALPRLLALPVRLWDEADWRGRPVYLDGVAAVVAGMVPHQGLVTLAAATGPPGFGPGDDGPVLSLDVDLLSDRIWWLRAADVTETSPDD